MTKQVIMNDLSNPTAHVVLVPLMAQGHTIPMLDLARLLAQRGVLTTFITTPLNATRIKTTIDRARDSNLPIHFVPLRFPCTEVGLLEGSENVDMLPTESDSKKFFYATTLLGPQLEAHLRAHRPNPTCIISDACHPWTIDVARNLQIPRLTFYGIPCFNLLCTHNITHHRMHDTITDETEPFVLPGLAQNIEITRAKSTGFFPKPNWEKMGQDVREADEASDGVVVNSFQELEPWYVDTYEKAVGKKIWVFGPLSLCNKQLADMATRGKESTIDTDQCLKWLDSMEPRSVVYVSFGTVTFTSQSQLVELGLGLEASGRPFIWVIKESEISPVVDTWLAEGFEERTRLRGLVIKGWAPQMMILSHPAVGGFVTHCGWNSTLEGVCAGVPMITWPFFADQFLNERMIVEVLRIGVEVGVKEPWYWGVNDDKVLVKRDDVEKTVARLMDEGNEGDERRERAKELAKKARKAMKEGGSSHVNMTHFIEHISQLASIKHAEEKQL